jgi:NADP-dependent 3-hydroxy acid dehydrogenase YdfG
MPFAFLTGGDCMIGEGITRPMIPASVTRSSVSRRAAACPGVDIFCRQAAIIVFRQSLAQEVGRHAIRVNSIAPGNAEARRKKHEPVRSPLGRATTGDDAGRAVA